MSDDDQAPAARQCDGCTACCTVCPIPDLGKGHMQRCEHELPGVGCRSYATRPGPCRSYRCAYLHGELREEDRPDRNGVLLEHTTLSKPDHASITVLVGLVFDRQPQLVVPSPVGPLITVLVGLVFDRQRYAEHGHRLARYARPGTLVVIAADGPEEHRLHGHPADAMAWLESMRDMARRGFHADREGRIVTEHHAGAAARREAPR